MEWSSVIQFIGYFDRDEMYFVGADEQIWKTVVRCREESGRLFSTWTRPTMGIRSFLMSLLYK